MSPLATASPVPDGIDCDRAESVGPASRHASRLSVLLLGAIVAIGLSGWVGGAPGTVHRTSSPHADLELDVPSVVRSGDVFETRLRVRVHAPVESLVVAIDPALWRNVTNNATLPAAQKESFERGQLRYAFGPVAAGATFQLQIDHQINPGLFGRNRGRLQVLDGARPLVETSVALTVMP